MWLDSVSVFHPSKLLVCESDGYDNGPSFDSNTHRLKMPLDYH